MVRCDLTGFDVAKNPLREVQYTSGVCWSATTLIAMTSPCDDEKAFKKIL